MKTRKWKNIRDVFKNMGFRSIIASALVFLLTVSATYMLGFLLCRSTKNSIILQGEGYYPTERPWFRETVVSSSEIRFIRPYVDKQTNRIMATVAMRLDDGESVLALDIDLERIQEITENIARQSSDGFGVVLDRRGQVIAHSDSAELGKYHPEETGTLGRALTDKLLFGNEKQFELSFGGRRYMVYVDEIEGGWLSVSLIDTEVFYRPLEIVSALLVLLTVTEAVVFLAVFYRMSEKNLAISIRDAQIAAVADMYMSIYDINIRDGSIKEIRRGKHSETQHVIGSASRSANEIRKNKDRLNQYCFANALPAV